ncbi:MAG: hypothetical protein OXR03_10015, partial [Rhodospirillaceae bacterium]|nr:hypothetical protein [Rhodospirillaceae bacterium]
VMDMVTGVGPRQRAYAGEVKSKFGVGLSNVNLSERPLIKGFNRIVGMMPLIGAPAAKARERVATEFLDAKDRLFIRSGPSLSKPEAATYLVQAAKKRYGAMSGRANKLYGNYRALAEEAGEIFPTEHLQLRAVETLDEATKAMARNRETGELIVPKSLREAWKTYNDAVEDAVMYGDRVTLPQLETIEGSLYAAANQIKEQAKGGGKAAAALQNAIMNMAREAQGAQRLVDPEGAGAEALAAVNKDDDFYYRMMGVFETKAAQAVIKTDPNALARGPRKFKRPTFNEDEVFDMMFSTKSADAQKQLLDVVGRPAYQKAVQTHVSNAFSKSITDKGFNSKQFLELTGLGNTGVREGTENAMNAAYRLAGVDRGRLELFADFAAKITRSDVPDMSTFVARRGMLGGIRSAARAFVPGAMVAGGAATAMGPVTGLGLTLGLRYVTGVMNKPVYKQLMEDIARNAPGSQGFRNSMTRLLRLGLEDLGAEGDAAVDEGRRMAHEAYQGLRAP